MTASRAALVVLAAIAVMLAIAHLAISSGGGTGAHAPFADLVATPPTELVWHGEGPPIMIQHGEMVLPSKGPVDPAAIDDVVAALRGARWQRQAATAPAGARFKLDVGGETLTIGPDVPGVGGWITRRHRAYLVDAWVIRALDRDALSLRVRPPFAGALAGLHHVELRGDDVDLVLDGTPLAVATPAGPVRLGADAARAVADDLAGVRIESLVGVNAATPPARQHVTVIGAARADLDILGPCPDQPDQVQVAGTTAGSACVGVQAMIGLTFAAKQIAADPIGVADPHLVVAAPKSIKLLSGATLAWRGATVEVDGAATDDDAVARVVTAITGPTTPVALPTPRPAPAGAFELDHVTFDLVGPDLVVERGAGYAHRVPGDVVAALRLTADELRDHVVVRTEPSLLTALAITERGATRQVAPNDAYAEQIAQAAQVLRVDRFGGPGAGATPRRTIVLTYAPPPTAGAQAEIHTIVLGTGCNAAIDEAAVALPHDLCTLLGKPLPP